MEVDGQTPPMAPTTCSRDFQQPHHSTLPPPLPTDFADAGPPHRLASHPAILASERGVFRRVPGMDPPSVDVHLREIDL